MSQAEHESTTTHGHPGPVAPDALLQAVTGPHSGFPATLAGDMPAHELRALARQIRRAAADEIERLIALLDRIEPDPDLEGAYHGHGPGTEDDEPGDDDELTAPENYGMGWSRPRPADDNDDDEDGHDREDDPAGEGGIGDMDGLIEQTDGEPSLGSFDRMTNQENWAKQRGDAGFYVVDAEQDDADREPSLGAGEPLYYDMLDQTLWASVAVTIASSTQPRSASRRIVSARAPPRNPRSACVPRSPRRSRPAALAGLLADHASRRALMRRSSAARRL